MTFPKDDAQRTPPHGDKLGREVIRRVDYAPQQSTSIYRICIALPKDSQNGYTDPSPHGKRLALDAVLRTLEANSVLDAFVTFGFGIGEWGTEHCVYIETCAPDNSHVFGFIQSLLIDWNQECAYVAIGAIGYEYHNTGRLSPITGVSHDGE